MVSNTVIKWELFPAKFLMSLGHYIIHDKDYVTIINLRLLSRL